MLETWETRFDPGVRKIPWRRAWQPTPVFLPRESPWTEEPGGLQSVGLQRVGHDWATKHNNTTSPQQEMWVWSLDQEGHLEENMATHSSILTWVMPWTEEPGRLQSIGSQRVRHNWSDLAWKHSVILAATAKSLQSRPTLCDPIDGSPPGSPVPGILQARTLEWVAISFSNAWNWKVKVKSLSCVQLLATPWTAAYQAPLPMGFSRQEYWSGLPFPSPGDLPSPGIELWSPTSQADILPSEPPGKPILKLRVFFYVQQNRIAVIFDVSYLPNMPDSLICWCSENRKGKMYDLH